MSTLRPFSSRTAILCVLALCAFASLAVAGSDGRSNADLMPAYDDDGRLRLPDGIERWVLAGTSLSLSYSEGAGGSDMFHHTMIEPSAYEHFRETGTFRDGTMLALYLHPQGEGALPSRGGTFADRLCFVEMAVKDSSRDGSPWAYYNFGPPGGRGVARALPSRSCQSCHDEHAAYDNVFLQFYPLLAGVAPEGSPAALALLERSSPTSEPMPTAAATEEPTALLALGGLDPVLLVDGRQEEGKEEIEVEHEGYVYRFLSEPSRARFAAEPEAFSIQNETCPVAPGAPVDPSVFSVHREKIYAFATPGCVSTFESDPESYLTDGASDASESADVD